MPGGWTGVNWSTAEMARHLTIAHWLSRSTCIIFETCLANRGGVPTVAR